jgi:hypothetical protein
MDEPTYILDLRSFMEEDLHAEGVTSTQGPSEGTTSGFELELLDQTPHLLMVRGPFRDNVASASIPSNETRSDYTDVSYTSEGNRQSISYTENSVKLRGMVAKGKSSGKEELGLAEAKCWIGEESTTDRKLELRMIFSAHPTTTMRYKFVGPGVPDELSTFVKHHAVYSPPEGKLSFTDQYFRVIHASLVSDGDSTAPIVGWMTTDTLQSFEVLVKKMILASLAAIEVGQKPEHI